MKVWKKQQRQSLWEKSYACSYSTSLYNDEENTALKHPNPLPWSFWINGVWEHFRLYEEELVCHKVCMFSSTYFRFQIKNGILLSKLDFCKILAYSPLLQKTRLQKTPLQNLNVFFSEFLKALISIDVLFNEGEKESRLVGMRNKVVTCREPEISTLKGTPAFYLDYMCWVTALRFEEE